ncbi:MAG: DoxX family protein [Planctomycetia bacterium]
MKSLGIDLGLLLIRLMVGWVFVFHGAQKVFGVFEGPGIAKFAEALASMGVPNHEPMAYAAAFAELLGGVSLILGFATRLFAVPLLVTMLVAAFVAHGKAFSLQAGGMEYALTLAVVSGAFVLTGPGRFSVDVLAFVRRATTAAPPPAE